MSVVLVPYIFRLVEGDTMAAHIYFMATSGRSQFEIYEYTER